MILQILLFSTLRRSISIIRIIRILLLLLCWTITDRKVSRMRNFAIVKKWQNNFDWFSLASRSILDWFSFVLRSFFVRPSFCLRSAFVHPSLDNRRSIEEQSKIYRKNNENAREPQGNNLRAATNLHRYMNEQASNGALCAMLSVELSLNV